MTKVSGLAPWSCAATAMDKNMGAGVETLMNGEGYRNDAWQW